jgi:acyl-CoA synthetase (AMP-forming)/AMP-acid ligase II
VNTTDFLSIANAICPERDAVVFGEKRWTVAHLNERVNRLSHALIGSGIEHGDRIGMLQVNCNQYVEAYFAAAKIGAIFVPLNFRAKADELSYMITNAQTKILFAGSRYLAMVDTLLPQLSTVTDCVTVDAEIAGRLYYEDLISSSSSDEIVSEIGDEDTTILMYTAGTTGRPKAVPLTHSGFISYVLENVAPADPEIEEKNLLTVPLYHVAGIQAMLAAVYGGRSLVMMKQFEVKEWLETVEREKATRAMLVPTMLKMIIDDPEFNRYNLESLKIITYGAAPMPFEVIKKAIAILPGVNFINAYGQTETASTITSLGPEDHIIEGTDEERHRKLKRLTSSIGKPLPDVEVKIVDEAGNPLPVLEVGEIMTHDGWLRTGDKGWMDEDGYIYLAGRSDDMIIRGGENISPAEVEGVLYSHPKIEDAAIIGIPDAKWGQVPRAIVALKKKEVATPEEIMEYCKLELAGFKRPRSIIFVDYLPRNQMGKVLKKELREKYGEPD